VLTITVTMQGDETADGEFLLRALWAVRTKDGPHSNNLVSFTHKAHDIGALALAIAEAAGRVEAHGPASRIIPPN
jgi:hypothetical protein